ncbi:hypothetical protein Tco_0512291 [Tanacetum coccineum]
MASLYTRDAVSTHCMHKSSRDLVQRLVAETPLSLREPPLAQTQCSGCGIYVSIESLKGSDSESVIAAK